MTFPFSEKVIGNISIKKNKIISILIVRDLVQHFSPIVFFTHNTNTLQC